MSTENQHLFNISERGQDFYNRTKAFIETEIEPIEADFGKKPTSKTPMATGANGNGQRS